MSGPPPSIIGDGISSVSTSTPKFDVTADRVLMFSRAIEGHKISMDTIRRYARSGIPDIHRPTYWKLLIGYLPPTPGEWEAVEEAKEQEYIGFLQDSCELDAVGNVVATNDKHRIDVDIPRTLPTLHFFGCSDDIMIKDGVPTTFSEAQHALRRILYSTARLNAGLGYVQGMNELVAHLLITFAGSKVSNINTRVEAQTFFCFQMLLMYVGDNFCRALDHDKTMGVMHTMDGFQHLFEYCDPELFAFIEECGIRPEFYAFRWITLLMTQEFLTPDVLRIWDYLLSFGPQLNDAVYYFTVAMLIFIRENLMEMEGMSQVLVALQHYPEDTDVNMLIELTEALIKRYGFEKVEELRREEEFRRRRAELKSSVADQQSGSTTPEGGSLDRKKDEVVKAVNKMMGRMFDWGSKFNSEKTNK